MCLCKAGIKFVCISHFFWRLVYIFTPTLDGQIIYHLALNLENINPMEKSVTFWATEYDRLYFYFVTERKEWRHREGTYILMQKVYIDHRSETYVLHKNWVDATWHDNFKANSA